MKNIIKSLDIKDKEEVKKTLQEIFNSLDDVIKIEIHYKK